MSEQFDAASNAFIARDEQGVARNVSHIHQPFISAATTPEQAARQYLDQHGGILGIGGQALASIGRSPETAAIDAPVEYRELSSKTMFDTTTVTFQQTYLGLPVWGAGVSVTVQALPREGAVEQQVISTRSTAHLDVEAANPPAATMQQLDTLDDSSLATLLGLTGKSVTFDAKSLRINQQNLVIYQYQAAERTQPPHPPQEKTGASLDNPLTLPLAPVPESIDEGAHYVASEVFFSLGSQRLGEMNWVAIIEANSRTVLYVRAFASDVDGMVFERDPITSHGSPGPKASNADLNPRRTSVTLPGLNPPSGGQQALSGGIVTLLDSEAPTIAPPTVATGNNFDYDARTDNFAAVNAYFNNDRFFRLVEELGFSRATYFGGTTFPTSVDHRGMGTTVNAHCLGISGGGGILRTTYALADTDDTANPIGIACDWRIVLHELGGHGILYNHVNSANFGFSHSAGDSFAAILNDPGTQAPNRFETFPWLGWDRFHNRAVADGWAWGGTQDKKGYDSEQILCTTHFRIYRSIGGDSADVNRQRFAARYMAYLILRTVGSLTKATNPKKALDYANALISSDAGDWTTEGLTGGVYGKVIRWSFEKQGLYQPAGTPTLVTSEGAPPAVDLYIDDGRGGEYPYQAVHWENPSVWNRTAADGGTTQQPGMAGVQSYAYVKVKNRGTTDASGIVKVYHCKPGAGLTWPTDFVQAEPLAGLPTGTVLAHNGNELVAGPFNWSPNVNTYGHDCLLAIVTAPGDPSNVENLAAGKTVPEWRLVPNDNNVGQRNVVLVPGGGGGKALNADLDGVVFSAGNSFNKRTLMELKVDVPAILAAKGWGLEFPGIPGNSFWLEVGEKRDIEVRVIKGGDFTADELRRGGDNPKIFATQTNDLTAGALRQDGDSFFVVHLYGDGILLGGMSYHVDPDIKEPVGKGKIPRRLNPAVPFISTWLVLGPIFDPSHQTGSHAGDDWRPKAPEIIVDIDHHAAQLDPRALTQAVSSAPGVGDIVRYGGWGTDGKTLFAERSYAWRKRYFAGLDWQSASDVGDDIHTHLAGDYDGDPFDPYNYLNFAGKHHALALLLVYILSPDERTTRIAVRSDDTLRLWLNGSEVSSPGGFPFLNEHDIINDDETLAGIHLKAGVNILLAAVAETHVEWGFSARIEDYQGLRFTADNPNRDPVAVFDSGYRHVSIAGSANAWNPEDPNRSLSHIGGGRWQGRVRLVDEPFKIVGHEKKFSTWWGPKGSDIFDDNFWNELPGIYDVTFDEKNPTQPVFILVKPFGKGA